MTTKERKDDPVGDVVRGAKVLIGRVKRYRYFLIRKRALRRMVNAEDKPVRNYVKRSMKKGHTASTAIAHAHVLHSERRISDSGKLKRS